MPLASASLGINQGGTAMMTIAPVQQGLFLYFGEQFGGCSRR